MGVAMPVHAQQAGELITVPAVPYGYDRGRNVAVADRPRPDYDALGIRAGGFMLYPRVEAGIGGSDNVYLSEGKKTGDLYGIVSPSLRAQSNWSRHSLSASAAGGFRRFFDETPRNEDTWRGSVRTRLDIGTAMTLSVEGQAGRVFETPFSGEVDANIAALSKYDYATASVRGQYSLGRTRLSLGYTRDDYSFRPIKFTDGTRFSQASRDRTIDNVTGQVDFALSPSASVYAKLNYENITYDVPLAAGIPKRSSQGYRAIGGLSVDLASFLRGTIGLGYTVRDFKSEAYDAVRGLSAEAEVEYFYSDLTTVTLRASRKIEDATLFSNSAFFDTRGGVRVDHELLRNLILNLGGEYSHQSYKGVDRTNDIYRISGGGKYLVSRSAFLSAAGTYSNRKSEDVLGRDTLGELRGEVTLTFQR
ncbi:outer membrane beta-barrel protein [Sphingomonas sp. ID0503]